MSTSSILSHGIVAIAAIALGLLAGHLLDKPAGDPEKTRVAHAPAPTETTHRMICVSDTFTLDDDKDAAASLALQWCQSQLGDCRRQRATLRKPWPDDPEVMTAAEWTQKVETAFDACELPFELDLVECSEYPCVAGLRPKTPIGIEDFSEFGSLKFGREELMACPELEGAFGTGDISDQVGFFQVNCPDGHTEQMALLYAPGPDVWEFEMEGTADTAMEWLRWMTRRADDVAARKLTARVAGRPVRAKMERIVLGPFLAASSSVHTISVPSGAHRLSPQLWAMTGSSGTKMSAR